MNVHIYRTISVYVGFILLFSACTFQLNRELTAGSKFQNFKYTLKDIEERDIKNQWLRGIPCTPPCWEGITPGMTTLTETFSILSQNISFVDIEIVHISKNSALRAIRIVETESGQSREYAVNVYSMPVAQGGVVTGFFIELPKMELQEVIAHYGPPSHVWAYIQPWSTDFQYWGVSLLWISQGFEIRVDGDGDFPIIDEKFIVGQRVNFFSPGIDGYNLAEGAHYHESEFFLWEGYGQIEDKAVILD